MKVLVADDHGLYRAGLGYLLRERLGVAEVIETGTLAEAIDLLDRHQGMRLALFDLAMPGVAGPQTLAEVKAAACRQTYIGAISASEDRADVIACVAAGLSGYIPKNLPDDEIASALALMLSGNVFVPPFMIAGAPAAPYAAPDPAPASRLEVLTPRQREVLAHILEGRSNKEIARKLAIAEGTVKIHLAALFGHFNAHNRTELATRAQAMRNGHAAARPRS